MASAKKANEIASLFLVQALERTKERVACWIEEKNLEQIDYTCHLGCVHILLSAKQSTWLENTINKTQGYHRQAHTVSYNGACVGTWAHREFNERIYLDFDLDPAFVVEYMAVSAEVLIEARQAVEAKENKYAAF